MEKDDGETSSLIAISDGDAVDVSLHVIPFVQALRSIGYRQRQELARVCLLW